MVLYGLFYYQTGLINRVVVPQFLDGFFMNLDVWIFDEFPAFFLRGNMGMQCSTSFSTLVII